ncbi:intraflagellar transport protein 46 homolog [Egretta garzetta]|nr:intraflagellar transport protein 46 homolog [Egretta garzetta]
MAFPAFVQTAAANSTCGEAPQGGSSGNPHALLCCTSAGHSWERAKEGQGKTWLGGGVRVQDGFLSEASLPRLSAAFTVVLRSWVPGSCLCRTYHKLIFACISLPSFSDFNLADYDYLPVSSEIKELFEYIKRYTPKTIEIEHKLQPFIPDFIPAVGDIDAFLKVPRPDGKPDNLGLLVLDEPSTKQSDPTVLSLWLTENSKQHNVTQQIKVKSLENAEKNPKAIDSWIESISELHRCKPPATVHYSRPMPDIETLMQEWSPEFEELLGKVGLPTAEMNCDLAEYVDMICAILDIPVYKSRVQPLHVLFSLYSEFKNSQHFKPLADGKKGRSPPSNPPSQAADVDVLSFT